MHMKNFVAPTMQDALQLVREELGENAVIFQTREVRPKGIFGPRHIEVSAARESIDDAAPARPTPPAQATPTPSAELQRALGAFSKTAGETYGPAVDEAVTPDVDDMEARLASLRKEIRGLREDLRAEEFESSRDALVDQLEGVREILAAYSLKAVGSTSDWFLNVLDGADVRGNLANLIAEEARSRFEAMMPTRLHDPSSAAGISIQSEALVNVITEALQAKRYQGPQKRQVMTLVGPTGVGKTTTLAKIAAHTSLVRKKRVGLISTDTYRVGAVEQLRHYADLIGVPMEVASTASEFAYAVSRFKNYDLILVDTAGRNPGDESQVPSLIELFGDISVEVHLALSVSTRRYEVADILERFKPLNPEAVVLTKCDEASVFGAVLNAVLGGGLPISYVTMGQRVPEDIARPRPAMLAQKLVDTVLEYARPELTEVVSNLKSRGQAA